MENTAGNELELNTSGAADVLSHCDDFLIAVSSSSTVDRSSGPVNEIGFEQKPTVETEADKFTSEDNEEMPKLIETPEPEKSRKNAKFNLRKSLAWDSAFFTSDGVLDADELSTMIEVGEKSVKHQLPGIEEEVYKSMDSISTFESDNLSLDCLEAELFDDIRASIQKSNKSSNLSNLSIKTPSGKKDSHPKISSSLKKADLDAGKQRGARTKDNISSIPQPKIMNKSSTSALTKRASLSVNHAKKDQDVAKKGTQMTKPTTIQGSKVAGVIGPRRALPKPSTTLKTDPTRPSSSSSSCSSGTDVKVNIPRKKVVSKTGKLTPGSIIPKTPSRVSMSNKQPPASCNLSSSISPASSISDWSPESRGSSADTSVSYSSLSNLPTPRISSQNGSQTGQLSRPPTFQPTGLRMPSPKIGFFDGGKTGVRTPTGGIRSQSTLPNGPTTSNGVKFGKIPPPKATITHANMKPNPQKAVPKPCQEQLTSKPKTKSNAAASDVLDHKSDTNTTITDGSRTPFAVKNSVFDTNGTSMEGTEKWVNISLLKSQQNENSEVVA